MTLKPNQFQKIILKWFDQHGRKNLPWQHNKTPYRVWISEVMLQQTQVKTVIEYYQRFMQCFPNINTLAQAHEDQVLHLWAGLGYYSRARMLHRTAKLIANEYQNQFPDNFSDLIALPGIGASTAGAILAIAFNQPASILDGNVKRLLTRLHGIAAPINEKIIEKKLWDLANLYTPKARVADYTQAIMDIGATLCTPKKPTCIACPFKKLCAAYQQNIVEQLPVKKSKSILPTRQSTFLIIKNNTQVFLYKRPNSGIWGGLWSLPELDGQADVGKINTFCQKYWQFSTNDVTPLSSFKHTFTHFRLQIYPVLIEIKKQKSKLMAADQQIWYKFDKPNMVGLPKPIKMILENIREPSNSLQKIK